jgi:hypothetical protein
MPEYRMTIMPIPLWRRNRDRILSQHMQDAATLGWTLVTANIHRPWWAPKEYHFIWVKMAR